MISYRPLFKTMAQKNISSYALFKMGFSKATYHSIKKGNSISTNTVNQSVAGCYIVLSLILWNISKMSLIVKFSISTD